MENNLTKVIAESDLRKTVLQVVKSISETTSNVNGVFLSNTKGEITNWHPEIARATAPNRGIENSIYRIILDGCARSEMMGAHSGEMTLEMILNLTNTCLARIESGCSPRDIISELQEASRRLQELIQVENTWPNSGDLFDTLEISKAGKLEKDLCKTAIDLSGLTGRIFTSKTQGAETSVELTTEHVFNLHPIAEVKHPDTQWDNYDVKVAIIDGIIESVSEINHLLIAASGKGVPPAVIFARGFSEEVVATLGLNIRRGTLNVLPVPVTFDAETANTLKDIAVILGADVITSLQGHLISDITWESLSIAKRVSFSDGVMRINPDQVSSGLNVHLSELNQRRQEMAPDARRDLIDSRIRSLTSRSVAIKIAGDDADFTCQKMDLLIRMIRSSISYGVIKKQDFEKDNDDYALARKWFDATSDVIPTISAFAAVKFSISSVISLVSLGSAVVLDFNV